MSDTQRSVLVINDGPMAYLPELRQAVPSCTFEVCREGEDVPQALERVQPEIVFGLHGGRFPAFSHAVTLDFPSAKWMHNGGAGIDHLPPWNAERIVVTNSAGVSSRFMAETVTGAILMMNFGFPQYFRQQQTHVWEKRPWTSLSTKTALIIGLGGIGSLVAERLSMFGVHVIGARKSSRHCDQVDQQILMEDIPDVLQRADYICIHVPNTDETQNMVDAAFLARMKPDAVLINTARGAQVDETALLTALKNKSIGGAYLDVFRQEPLATDSPFWDMPNVIITPHHSDAAKGWEIASARFFRENLNRYLTKQPLENICDPKSGY